MVFAWYLVVPPAIDFLVGYNDNAFDYQLRAKDYIQFVLLTLLAMGIVFEMPVVMLILARLRIMSSALMRRHWRISIVVLAVVAMLLPGSIRSRSSSSSSRCSPSTASPTSSCEGREGAG